MTLRSCQVHAKGRFLRRFSTLKMLLSGYLDEEKVILADPRTLPAKFFLFREGKFLGKNGRFCSLHKGFKVSEFQSCKVWRLKGWTLRLFASIGFCNLETFETLKPNLLFLFFIQLNPQRLEKFQILIADF
jgi:hypothetical protein